MNDINATIADVEDGIEDASPPSLTRRNGGDVGTVDGERKIPGFMHS